ncbi:hypothetical protein CQ047_17845 [Microbacterium sp. MYb72]|uniref:DUF6093 family protein n=1 Tax=Microbacterium sp. MYb72 TaxID=1848693 RepID=UPI000CFAE753|nr:DUF6093 family protein [Microbacterium sp. MYb72]PRB02767.1 hypothetical protein CQ047_17845 [Microbacterium sp. MYb72]
MIGDDIDAALPELREHAESRMTDTVAVGLYADSTDPATGDALRVLTTERYAGIGRLRWSSRDVAATPLPAQSVAVQDPYLSIPYGSPLLVKGDEVAVTASADPLMAGRRFSIDGRPAAGQVTAYRYPLKELT